MSQKTGILKTDEMNRGYVLFNNGKYIVERKGEDNRKSNDKALTLNQSLW